MSTVKPLERVYIAHAITNGGTNNSEAVFKNTADYLKWCKFAMDRNLTVISWLHHVALAELYGHVLRYDQWLAHCFQLINTCNIFVVASDPIESIGVSQELGFAMGLSKFIDNWYNISEYTREKDKIQPNLKAIANLSDFILGGL